MVKRASRRILFVTQVYPPDPAAVGQYLAEVTEELVRRDYDVVVLTSDRGYDDPTIKLDRTEIRSGVQNLSLATDVFREGQHRQSFGWRDFLVCSGHGRRPPRRWLSKRLSLDGAAGGRRNRGASERLENVPFDYWLMDSNPDQAVQLGKAEPDSTSVRVLDGLNRQILARARNVFALDEAMADRFARKLDGKKPVQVLPLWPLKESRMPTPEGVDQFLTEHSLKGARVVMHSGNHSIVHPLETLVDAVKRMPTTTPLRFLFVGGGVAKRPIDTWVRESQPPHVQTLPYQPIERLGDVLGAASVHVVVVGPTTVGIVHPSKLYGALAAGKPILVLGPKDAPAARLVRDHGIGWHVEHGDVTRMQQVLAEVETLSGKDLDDMGTRALALANGEFSRSALLERLVRAVTAED
ncbi:MAG: glycosyltransferase family 4 protein [Polyangiaceae bacterium]